MKLVLLASPALPAIGSVVVFLLRRDRRASLWGIWFAVVGFIATCALPLGIGDGPTWHRIDLPWADGLGLRFDLGVDGISYPLMVLTALLTTLCCVHVWLNPPRAADPAVLVALLLATNAAIVTVFSTFNLVVFFIAFECVLLPMYAIIARYGGSGRRHAANKFALYTLFGSLLMLVGIFIVVSQTGTADLVTLARTGADGMTTTTQVIAFSLLAVGFAVKSPLWPLHTWLPDAHTQAPTVGSVILAGVLLKLGTYGLIRVGLTAAPEGAARLAPVLAVLAVTAILVGGYACLAQTELKRLIAYSSVGHMGFVVLGIATLTDVGIRAALYGNIAHGLITGLLFFLVGSIKHRTGTGDLAKLGGLRDHAPQLAGIFAFTAIASLGMPGLAGFWGEALAIYAAISQGSQLWTVLAVIAALGAVLAPAYLLRMLRYVTYGPVSDATENVTETRRRDLVMWAPMALLILLLGIAPWLLLDGFSAPVLEWVIAV